jgi:hypothetical protein
MTYVILMGHNVQHITVSRRGILSRALWLCDFEFIHVILV